MLVNLLAQEYDVDLNGVIMLSQILNFDLSVDDPEGNPGIDHALHLWHCRPTPPAPVVPITRLPGPNSPAALEPFVKEVEEFATHDYARALAARSDSAESRTPGHCRKTARLHRPSR